MPKDGKATRLKILEETTKLVFDNGFSGTTIDLIIARAKITKGAFFYHFPNKADLALKLIEQFSEQDLKLLHEVKTATTQPGGSPKSQILAFVQWFINYFDKLDEPYSGCLYASFIYEPEQFDAEIKSIVSKSILEWRQELKEMIENAITGREPKPDIHIESLADMFSVILEGAFIMSKALNDAKLTANQLKHYKSYLETLL